jgi:hypothetical protein
MKTTDKLILISGLAYGVLFYQQDFGTNFLIYSIIQLIGIFLISEKEKRNKHWWLSFAGVVIAAAGVFLNGSFLAVFANVVSLFVLAALTIESRSSIVVSIIQSIYSVLTGLLFIITDIADKAMDKSGIKSKSRGFKNFVIFLASTGVALLFFALYRNANPAFEEFTNQIDLSFISMGWIGFTLLGYYFIYQMYKHNRIKDLETYDLNAADHIMAKLEPSQIEGMMSVESEVKWAKTLLIMLNILLVMVLLVDACYFSGLYELSSEVSHSASVHQGIDALIFSIILAVSVILFFFKGRLNFMDNNKTVKLLALTWVVQNVVLVVFTGLKNVEYVQEYFLTYKRIGVFIYLVCCVVGLVYTFLKIYEIRSNWFLVRRVGWSLYALAIVTPIINWDALIINYNFSASATKPENLDINYMMKLPKVNYPLIQQNLRNYNGVIEKDVIQQLNSVNEHPSDYYVSDWRSFNVRKYLAFKSISQ